MASKSKPNSPPPNDAGLIAVQAYVPANLLYFDPIEQHSFECISVDDGDGLTLRLGIRSFSCRLWGVDAPEYDQPFADHAKEFLAAHCLSQHVYAIPLGHDRYSRTLVHIHTLTGLDIAAGLVLHGLAWVYARYTPPSSPLHTLELFAREHRRGIWSLPRPVAPWAHRKTPQWKQRR
jgi:micrococcal nuclease